jgi:hypothetical protein
VKALSLLHAMLIDMDSASPLFFAIIALSIHSLVSGIVCPYGAIALQTLQTCLSIQEIIIERQYCVVLKPLSVNIQYIMHFPLINRALYGTIVNQSLTEFSL